MLGATDFMFRGHHDTWYFSDTIFVTVRISRVEKTFNTCVGTSCYRFLRKEIIVRVDESADYGQGTVILIF